MGTDISWNKSEVFRGQPQENLLFLKSVSINKLLSEQCGSTKYKTKKRKEKWSKNTSDKCHEVFQFHEKFKDKWIYFRVYFFVHFTLGWIGYIKSRDTQMWQITAKPLSISANIPPTAILNIKVYISCFQGVRERKSFINQHCLRATFGNCRIHRGKCRAVRGCEGYLRLRNGPKLQNKHSMLVPYLAWRKIAWNVALRSALTGLQQAAATRGLVKRETF